MTTPLAEHEEVRSAIDLLGAWIEAQRVYRELPGLSMAIVHDQTVVWARGFGYADVGQREPATAATLSRIGSITKLFTATAILILRDAGKLRLDDPLTAHLPWFEMKGASPDGPRGASVAARSSRRACANPAPNSCVGVIRGLDAVYTNVYRNLSASNGTRKRGGEISTSTVSISETLP